MNFRDEIIKERKKYLGLTEEDTKKIYDTIISFYKERIVKSSRNIVEITIDIVICNMNYYNRLGKLEDLNKTCGDRNFYVDLKNSAFVELEINSEGYLEDNDNEIIFSDISSFNCIENISFSLKEMIELCKSDDFNIRIYANDNDQDETTIEIRPYKEFVMDKSIETYLETLK